MNKIQKSWVNSMNLLHTYQIITTEVKIQHMSMISKLPSHSSSVSTQLLNATSVLILLLSMIFSCSWASCKQNDILVCTLFYLASFTQCDTYNLHSDYCRNHSFVLLLLCSTPFYQPSLFMHPFSYWWIFCLFSVESVMKKAAVDICVHIILCNQIRIYYLSVMFT